MRNSLRRVTSLNENISNRVFYIEYLYQQSKNNVKPISTKLTFTWNVHPYPYQYTVSFIMDKTT